VTVKTTGAAHAGGAAEATGEAAVNSGHQLAPEASQ
jgi:hypothetical protein